MFWWFRPQLASLKTFLRNILNNNSCSRDDASELEAESLNIKYFRPSTREDSLINLRRQRFKSYMKLIKFDEL